MTNIMEQLNSHFKNSLVDTNPTYNEFSETKPYFTKLKGQKKTKTNNKSILILWDIENISFKGAISEFSSLSKNAETIKVVSIRKDGHFSTSEDKNNIYYIKQQLVNKKWHIHQEKKDADNGLYYFWNKYKNSINQLVLISNDKDFERILIEANNMDLDYKILYTHPQTNWLLKYNNTFIDNENTWLLPFKDTI